MSIPAAQVDPFIRKLGKSKRRRPKNKVGRRQTDTKPSSAGPPKTIFGRPKPPPPPQRRALDWRGLRERGIHYHPNYARRLWNRGDFPKPFKPSPRRLAWWSDEIDDWLEKAAAGKQTNNAELPAEPAAVADSEVDFKAAVASEVDLRAAMRALERRCRALERELQAAKKPKPAAKRKAP